MFLLALGFGDGIGKVGQGGRREGKKEEGREGGREGGNLFFVFTLDQFCFYLCLVNLDPVMCVRVCACGVFLSYLSPTSS